MSPWNTSHKQYIRKHGNYPFTTTTTKKKEGIFQFFGYFKILTTLFSEKQLHKLVITTSNLKNHRRDSWDNSSKDDFFFCSWRLCLWTQLSNTTHMRQDSICTCVVHEYGKEKQIPAVFLHLSSPVSCYLWASLFLLTTIPKSLSNSYFVSPLFLTTHRPMRETMSWYSLLPMIPCFPTTFLIIFPTIVIHEWDQPTPSLDRLKFIQEGNGKHSRWHTMFHPLNT